MAGPGRPSARAGVPGVGPAIHVDPRDKPEDDDLEAVQPDRIAIWPAANEGNAMTTPVLGLAAAYLVLAVLLLSLNLTSLWRWWIKAGATVITTGFFAVTYLAVTGLMGWPTTQRLPPRFNLVSARIVEPDKKTSSAGAVYIWAETLDENNVPAGTPRSYRLAYTDALAQKIAKAQEERNQGHEVMGRLNDDPGRRGDETGKEIKMGQLRKNGEEIAAMDTVPDAASLNFEDLPPVVLPDKERY
jgi:hypothetical protein